MHALKPKVPVALESTVQRMIAELVRHSYALATDSEGSMGRVKSAERSVLRHAQQLDDLSGVSELSEEDLLRIGRLMKSLGKLMHERKNAR